MLFSCWRQGSLHTASYLPVQTRCISSCNSAPEIKKKIKKIKAGTISMLSKRHQLMKWKEQLAMSLPRCSPVLPSPIFAFKFLEKAVRRLVPPLALSWGHKAGFKSQLGVSLVKGNIEWHRANIAHLGNPLLQHEWRKEIRQSPDADSERPESF